MTRLSEQLVGIWRGERPNETAGSHRFTAGTEVAEKWEPQIVEQEQLLTPEVPTVPGVPTNFDKGHGRAEPSEAEELRFRWEERAAILEFEGGYDRTEAEALAWLEIGGKAPVRCSYAKELCRLEAVTPRDSEAHLAASPFRSDVS